ncbi:MAG TPA: DUF6143 family protein [Mobilitalea sp.]|nr:DUF6143 family protein [Mobilitalea sp.]
MSDRRTEFPEEIVDITSPGWNSRLGRYFIGQTGVLNFGSQTDAWAGVINPLDSGVNLYFDIFTITNFGEQSFTAEIWLNANTPSFNDGYATIVPSNQSISPPPKPKCYMLQAERLKEDLAEGVNIFDRIVTSNSTLVSDSHQGSITIGPGGSVSILLKSSGRDTVNSAIVLTWWEEKAERR